MRTLWRFIKNPIVLIVVGFFALVSVIFYVDAQSCIEDCVAAEIQPTRAKCEWVCEHGKSNPSVFPAPMPMPVPTK